jgi:hypothetical protein
LQLCYIGPQLSSAGLPDSRGNQALKDQDEEEALLDTNGVEMMREVELQKKRECTPTLFGVEMTPDTIAIATVYFVQGVLGLARLAVSFFLKDDLHLDPAEVMTLYFFKLH